MSTVIPHYLKSYETDSSKTDSEHFTNKSLRYGVVIKAYYPKDPKNTNKNFMEYDVNVNVRNGLNTREVNTVYRCICANLLGSTDYIKFALRVDPSQLQNNQISEGANVLILCANGETTNAIIIGGTSNGGSHSNNKSTTPPDPNSGLFYQFLYNGVGINVDNDGQLSISAAGATKIDGSPDDNRPETNKTPTINFTKEGNLQLTDNTTESVLLDTVNSALNIEAGKQIEVTAPQVGLGPDPIGGALNGIAYNEALAPINQTLIPLLTTIAALSALPVVPGATLVPILTDIVAALQAIIGSIQPSTSQSVIISK